METLYPLCFNESLDELQLENYECSDGIYVSGSRFRLLMNDADESLVIIGVKRGDSTICAYIRGMHTGDDENVYAPSWICQALQADPGTTVELIRQYPGIGVSITIKPHTSDYSLLEDPVSELRNAFENYSCLVAGYDIPLNVAGELLIVSIIDTGATGPVCIRGNELEVKIETPLDKELEERDEEERLQIAVAEAASAAANALLEEERQLKAEADRKRFPGRGQRLDGKNVD